MSENSIATTERMNKKLAEAFNGPWGSHGVLRPELAEIAGFDAPQGPSGVLRLYVSTRSGEEAVVFERHFVGLKDLEAVDDFLAEALSSLLATHASWPR